MHKSERLNTNKSTNVSFVFRLIVKIYQVDREYLKLHFDINTRTDWTILLYDNPSIEQFKHFQAEKYHIELCLRELYDIIQNSLSKEWFCSFPILSYFYSFLSCITCSVHFITSEAISLDFYNVLISSTAQSHILFSFVVSSFFFVNIFIKVYIYLSY